MNGLKPDTKSKNIYLWGAVLDLPTTQLPCRLFSPSDICKKQSHQFLLHFDLLMSMNKVVCKIQNLPIAPSNVLYAPIELCIGIKLCMFI